MPTSLSLLLFQQWSIFPQDTAHWALYLVEDGSQSGTMFHAAKESLIGWTRYTLIPNLQPETSSSLRSAVLIKSGSYITSEVLNMTCNEVARGRPFDLIVNNCQRYCTQVLLKLVSAGYITRAEFDALASKGFMPLV